MSNLRLFLTVVGLIFGIRCCLVFCILILKISDKLFLELRVLQTVFG